MMPWECATSGEFIDLVKSPWMTAGYNKELWAVTMPQLAQKNQTLRYAAIAIGALSKWHCQNWSGIPSQGVGTRSPPRRRERALPQAVAYYCRSLKLQKKQNSIPDAVFLSVLFLFFETLRGNRKATLDHINHGLTLLLALTTDDDRHYHAASFGPNPRPVMGSVAGIFIFLATQACTVFRGRVGRDAPLPNLMQGLQSRKHTMWSFMVLLSQLSQTPTILDRIPAAFDTLDEFEEHWINVRRKQTAVVLVMHEVVHASRILKSEGDADLTSFFLELAGSSKVEEFCDEFRSVMESLDAAYLPLFQKDHHVRSRISDILASYPPAAAASWSIYFRRYAGAP